MTEDRLRLNRRKVLAGIGAIGAAGAGAGLGTSALFSDEESFEGNSFTAGDMNMQVAAHVRDQNSEMPLVEISSDTNPQDTADGNTVTITASDVKPGDWFIIEWDITVCSNPAYVRVTSIDEEYVNSEGQNPESETDTSSPGDLGRAMLSSIWHSYSPVSNDDTRSELGTLDRTTDLNDTGLAGYESPDTDGVTASGAHYTTMDESHGVYETGVLLRDLSSGDPTEVGCMEAGVSYFQLFELPPGVGNDVQGDSVTFTLRFDAEQVRNNDDPFQS